MMSNEFKDKKRVEQAMDLAIRLLSDQAGEEIGIAIVTLPGGSPVDSTTAMLVTANSGDDKDIIVDLLAEASVRIMARLEKLRSMN